MVIERYVAARPATEPGPEVLQRLTPREREVMRQIARGLSNQDIAALLVLGQATVKTHVARILMKLALRDRAQVVVIAYECGLVSPGERT
jgi:DNA-binding NarL/FixJ family response regulator